MHPFVSEVKTTRLRSSVPHGPSIPLPRKMDVKPDAQKP